MILYDTIYIKERHIYVYLSFVHLIYKSSQTSFIYIHISISISISIYACEHVSLTNSHNFLHTDGPITKRGIFINLSSSIKIEDLADRRPAYCVLSQFPRVFADSALLNEPAASYEALLVHRRRR